MSESEKSWRQRLAGPALAVLMVVCCLGAPLVIGAAGALNVGALCGLAAGAIVLLGLCLFLTRRLRSGAGKGC